MARSSSVPWGPEGRNSADPGIRAADLVVVNVGNTHVRLARYTAGRLADDMRVPTATAGPADLPAGLPIAMVSVVPAVAAALAAGREVFMVEAATVQGLRIAYDPPAALGADRLANALALWRGFGPGIAVDCGTATTLTVVDPAGVLRGGAIMPGLGTARDALWKRTAQLPEVPLAPVASAIGASTLASMQAGLVEGHVGAVLHLVARMRAECPGLDALVVTGGWSALLAPLLPGAAHEPDLTIAGAALAWAEAHGA